MRIQFFLIKRKVSKVRIQILIIERKVSLSAYIQNAKDMIEKIKVYINEVLLTKISLR